MQKRYAVVRAGIVENVIIWDGTSALNLTGVELVETDEAGIGWRYEAGSFIAPPELQEAE